MHLTATDESYCWWVWLMMSSMQFSVSFIVSTSFLREPTRESSLLSLPRQSSPRRIFEMNSPRRASMSKRLSCQTVTDPRWVSVLLWHLLCFSNSRWILKTLFSCLFTPSIPSQPFPERKSFQNSVFWTVLNFRRSEAKFQLVQQV